MKLFRRRGDTDLQNAMTDRLYEPSAAPRRDWLVTALLVLAAHVAVLALPLLTPSLELLPGHPLLATLVHGPENASSHPSAAPVKASHAPERPAAAPALNLPVAPTAVMAEETRVLPPAGQPAAAPAAPVSAPAEVAPVSAPAPSTTGSPAVGQTPARVVETDVEIVCPRQPGAVYPALSQRLGETGRAVVRLELDLSGHIASRAILQSSGSSRLDKAALAAVDRYQCKPALLDGRPVPATTTQQFEFVLK
jgi:protein TonB